jgi:hypothetical protein
MSLTRAVVSGREACFQQIEKLTNSHILRSSESLCRLLRYLAEHTLDHPDVPLKEYQIATEVLGRATNFDPQSDATVRVQAGRLRIKLVEYYSHDGIDDPVVVELPRGSYALAFHVRTVEQPSSRAHPIPVEPVHEQTASVPRRNGWMIACVVLAVLLVVAMAMAASLWMSRSSSAGVAAASTATSIPQSYRIFWSRFVGAAQQPWIIFSNGNFIGRPETGMRYFNPASDSRGMILDHYTGVGEVLAVHELDRVFGLFQRPIRVKRGSLFSLDDAESNDLIFLGSPAENLTLLEIPATQEFVFQRATTGPRKGDLGLQNVHPLPGESEMYMASPPGQPTSEDYAVISLGPGLDPARSTLILGGTTTLGTQAAAEYVTRANNLAELLQRLHVSRSEDLKPFEALLHVKITAGVPVQTDLISARSKKSATR